MSVSDIICAIFILPGSFLSLTAALGILRFPDTLTRMHAATKPATLGLLLVLIGAIIRLWGNLDVGMLILCGVFSLITAPVTGHRIGRTAYQEEKLEDKLIHPDELRNET